MIPIRAPNNLPSDRNVEENSEVFTLEKLAENQANVPITVDDMMSVSPDMMKSKTSESPVKVLSPTSPTLTIPSVNEIVHSPSQNPNLVFNVPESPNTFMQPAKSPTSNVDVHKNISLTKQINECIDNAQNMKIACTDDVPSSAKMFVFSSIGIK